MPITRKRVSYLIICLAVVVVAIALAPKLIGLIVQGRTQPQGETNLRFTEVETDFSHRFDADEALPFMALAALDVDGDGIDEVFVGGGFGQPDALLRYANGEFVTTSEAGSFYKASGEVSYGAGSLDLDGDGDVDLIVARDTGLYLFENRDGSFAGSIIDFPLDPQSMPLSVSFGDINKDGFADLFVSNYIRPEFVEGETIFNQEYGGISNLLLNNGDNTFADITRSSGLYVQHNTFTAAFVDLDNDGWSDLIVAHDTGMPRVYRNNGDLTFTDVELPVTFSYPMGIAVSDYNNDGLMDIYFSNVGKTLPDFLLRGDLRKDQTLNKDYILLQNNGDFRFTDAAADLNADNYGFGWGLVSFDFNNDTLADYLITQNYIRFPKVELLELYPGNLLQQYPEGGFKPVEKVAGIENKLFGVTTIVSDFNEDGWPDAVIGNLNGDLRAFLNDGGDNNWLKVRLPDAPSSIGARVRLTTSDGATYFNQFYTSEGLGSDQTSDLFFGLGSSESLAELEVAYQNGDTLRIPNPAINSLIHAR